MPSLTINGQSITVDASFDKLSPEDQQATVVHIAKQLHDGASKATSADEKPSGVGSGLAQGISDTAGGLASTLGLTGAKSDTLKAVEDKTAVKDYKAAPLIREGGHWYNPGDYQPGNLPQIMAQAAPGMAVDMAAGKTGASVGSKLGARGALVGGIGGVLASIAARTAGKGAHENAEARTGNPDAPVTTPDLLREGAKQAIAAPLNAFGGARLAGLTGKAAGVGLSGAGKGVMNTLGTMGAEGAAGGVTDAVNQVGTSLGQEHGRPYDPNQTAEAVAAGGATSGALVAPRLAGKLVNSAKFREFGGANAPAAEALANDITRAADGSSLVGVAGGTKTAAHATATAADNAHLDLKAASKDLDLTGDVGNTLQRIQSGGKANASELRALEAEAPEVGLLARKALLASKLKKMGNFSENSFSGGLSGLMEKGVKAVANPVGAVTAAGATALAGATGTLGTFGLPVLGAIGGGYGLARILDKVTGARSPAKGFTDTFANPDAPVVAPPAPEPVDPNYDPTPLRQELNTNARLEEGLSKITGKLGAEKRKALLAEAKPLLAQLAATRTEPEAPTPEAPWSPNPVAMKMAQTRIKAGLPPIEEPVVAPEPTPAPPPPVVISPIARKMLEKKLKEGLPPEPTAPIAPEPAPVPETPSFNPTALKMLQGKLKAGLPPIAPDAPAPLSPAASIAAEPATGPASDAIGALMAHLRAKSAAGVQAPAPQAPQAPPTAPVAPPAPVKAPADGLTSFTGVDWQNINRTPEAPALKISKKSGEDVKETAAPAEEAYVPIPDKELYRRQMTDEEMVHHEFSRYEPSKKKSYAETSVSNREGNRDDTLGVAADYAAADRSAANALYHQLDHTKDPEVARRVIKHYTAQMSPEAAAAVNARYTPEIIAHRWKKRKKK
jgi:hypothetical protein